MEDYDGGDVLAELARLCDELGLYHTGSEAMACETHIFVDTNGNPHECWEAGPGHINVTVAMTPGQAVHITDVMAENAKLRELVADMWHEGAFEPGAYCAKEAGRLEERTRELGIEVSK